ncbi:MAG: S-methyl-5'-thioadenosine phosphorylase, partial [Candidatus Bathyarchaeia archaeon]
MEYKVAVIGGTGLEKLLDMVSRKVEMVTPYGSSQPMYFTQIEGFPVIFMPRHGAGHEMPPHMVNYRANIWALKRMGVERILATNAVGAVNPGYAPGDLVIPHDIIDLTRRRSASFYDEPPVYHVDFSQPYCPELRESLIRAGGSVSRRMWREGVYACTEGPRFETPAEIRAIARLGGDIVGMTGVPEAFLAREMELCYASLCYVSNMAAGLQERLTAGEVVKIGEEVTSDIYMLIKEALRQIPEERGCPCKSALMSSR